MSNELIDDIIILYVEDDENTRSIFSRSLKRKIKHVLVAQNGEEGYNSYLKNKPDLIITDIKMPVMDGLEMCSIIRDENSNIPIIVTTAHSEAHLFQEAINIGIDMFLLKPVNMTQLYNTVKVMADDILLKIKMHKEKEVIIEEYSSIDLKELLVNVAHQWRQPLAAISAATLNMNFSLSTEEYENVDFDEKVLSIDDSVKYLSTILDHFKHFSKNNNTYVFDIKESLQKAINIEAQTLKSKKIKLFAQFDESLSAKGLPDDFVQIIINIINNSVEALENSNDKVIYICAKNVDNKVQINIKDSGHGIKKEMINHLFQPYSSTKHKSLGTGLGLFVVYKTIKNIMQGKVFAKNSSFEYKNKQYSGANIQIEF